PRPAAVGVTRRGRVLAPIAGGATSLERSRDSLEILTEDQLVLPEYAIPATRRSFRGRIGEGMTPVWVLTAVGFVLRVALINAQSLRLDESLSLRQVRQFSLPGLWHYLASQNVHVPAFHTLMWVWVRLFGASEWVLRVPSVLFGTACIPLIYLVARRIADERAALFTATLATAAPFWVW